MRSEVRDGKKKGKAQGHSRTEVCGGSLRGNRGLAGFRNPVQGLDHIGQKQSHKSDRLLVYTTFSSAGAVLREVRFANMKGGVAKSWETLGQSARWSSARGAGALEPPAP